MTTFDEREKAFEKKFAHDQELKFKSEARRNRLIGRWAAEKLGISGEEEITAYVKAVQRADLEEKGDDDVFRKLRKDFDAKSLSISDSDIREAMSAMLASAVEQIESERK
ncbi:MAG: DUF1476 domain-containing protein [Hyphomicrobiaceae bacterium]